MSLLPLLCDLTDDPTDPTFNRCNHIGRSVLPYELELLPTPTTSPCPSEFHTGYHRCPRVWSNLKNVADIAKSASSKDGFQVCLDVYQFAPNEIAVKTVDDTIVVEAKHEERQDEHGYISRQFTRRYDLPQGFNIKDVGTQLSSDGILTIKAPPEANALEEGNVRILQIQHTGPTRLGVGRMGNGKGDQATTDKVENGAK